MNYNTYKSRKGVKVISWDDFYGLCKGLALALSLYKPEIILGITRGGLYPATQISHLLQAEFYPIRLSRRENDKIVREHPIWLSNPPSIIAKKKVLIVDEICDSGETLNLAKKMVEEMGANEVKIAVLYSHEYGSKIPDYIGIITDELILNPWDREILKSGKFIFNDEYASALKLQNLKIEKYFISKIKPAKLAKR